MSLRRTILIAALVAWAAPARADFVTGGGSGLPTGKVDLYPAPNSINYVSASDWNTAMQALLDVREKLFNYGIQTVTSSTTLGATSSTYDVNATGLTLTLPVSSAGTMYLIKDVTGNSNPNCIVSPSSGLIDGVATKTITIAYGWVAVRFNGTNWEVVSQGPPPGSGLLGAYLSASSSAQNVVAETSALGAVVLRDNATPLGSVFDVTDSSASNHYLTASSTGVAQHGPFNIGASTGVGWVYLANDTTGAFQNSPDIEQCGYGFDGVTYQRVCWFQQAASTVSGGSYTDAISWYAKRGGTFVATPGLRMTFDGSNHTAVFGGGLQVPPAASLGNSSQAATNTTAVTVAPNVADGASSVGLAVNTGTTLSTAGASLFSVSNNGALGLSMKFTFGYPALTFDANSSVTDFFPIWMQFNNHGYANSVAVESMGSRSGLTFMAAANGYPSSSIIGASFARGVSAVAYSATPAFTPYSAPYSFGAFRTGSVAGNITGATIVNGQEGEFISILFQKDATANQYTLHFTGTNVVWPQDLAFPAAASSVIATEWEWDNSLATPAWMLKSASTSKNPTAALGNWVVSGNNADLLAAGTLGIGLTTATAVQVGSFTFSGNGLTGTTNLTQTLGSASLRYLATYSESYIGVLQTVPAAASLTINPTLGETIRITLSATAITSLTVSAGSSGQTLVVEVIEDATGTRSIPTTWTNVKFAGGTYTATPTANKRDELTLRYDSSDAVWVEQARSMNL